jgi:hypothetical protein
MKRVERQGADGDVRATKEKTAALTGPLWLPSAAQTQWRDDRILWLVVVLTA